MSPGALGAAVTGAAEYEKGVREGMAIATRALESRLSSTERRAFEADAASLLESRQLRVRPLYSEDKRKDWHPDEPEEFPEAPRGGLVEVAEKQRA